jgi:hypothetical protein
MSANDFKSGLNSTYLYVPAAEVVLEGARVVACHVWTAVSAAWFLVREPGSSLNARWLSRESFCSRNNQKGGSTYGWTVEARPSDRRGSALPLQAVAAVAAVAAAAAAAAAASAAVKRRQSSYRACGCCWLIAAQPAHGAARVGYAWQSRPRVRLRGSRHRPGLS